jgi:predicted anti-sigma-YlaC factor YlaD
MSCLSLEELYAYLDGDLPPAAKRRVEAHAVACAECRTVIEDRRAFLEAASSLPVFDVPASFASSIAARLETVPAPERKRLPIWTWIAASASGSAAFIATLALIALVTGQNLWQYLARLQHGFLDYLQGAATAIIRLLKYIQIFLKIAGDFGSALMDVVKQAAALISPPVQAACAVSAVIILAMGVVLWRRRALSLENHHDE